MVTTDLPTRDAAGCAPATGARCEACLCYVSSATRLLDPEELDALLEQSRARNEVLGLTGMLLHCDGSFMQYLEGPAAGLATVWQSIQRDPRHRHVTLVFEASAAGRRFADWRMACRATDRPDFDAIVAAAQGGRAPVDDAGHAGPHIVADLLRQFWDMHQPGRR